MTPLGRFLLEVANAKFGSPRQLSLQAGLSQNTVGNIIDGGGASAETLRKLAPLVGKTPKQLFVLAGRLPDEEGGLTPFQEILLLEAAQIPEEAQGVFLDLVRAAARAALGYREMLARTPSPEADARLGTSA